MLIVCATVFLQVQNSTIWQIFVIVSIQLLWFLKKRECNFVVTLYRSFPFSEAVTVSRIIFVCDRSQRGKGQPTLDTYGVCDFIGLSYFSVLRPLLE